jgi:hypothetical protein
MLVSIEKFAWPRGQMSNTNVVLSRRLHVYLESLKSIEWLAHASTFDRPIHIAHPLSLMIERGYSFEAEGNRLGSDLSWDALDAIIEGLDLATPSANPTSDIAILQPEFHSV